MTCSDTCSSSIVFRYSRYQSSRLFGICARFLDHGEYLIAEVLCTLRIVRFGHRSHSHRFFSISYLCDRPPGLELLLPLSDLCVMAKVLQTIGPGLQNIQSACSAFCRHRVYICPICGACNRLELSLFLHTCHSFGWHPGSYLQFATAADSARCVNICLRCSDYERPQFSDGNPYLKASPLMMGGTSIFPFRGFVCGQTMLEQHPRDEGSHVDVSIVRGVPPTSAAFSAPIRVVVCDQTMLGKLSSGLFCGGPY